MQGSFRLFQVFGINVYLHWSWFVVAIFGIQTRMDAYTSIAFPAVEYLALFLIVLLHEFGHALACRSVGGQASQIVLWPLGGVAYVNPPPRPGANLWSIAAGPLVNVALFPLLSIAWWIAAHSGVQYDGPNTYHLIRAVWFINTALLVFNLLPVFPLDGGQILRSLLWFALGPAKSLLVATIIGFAGVIGLIGLAIWLQSVWTGIICVFIGMNCWSGFVHARMLLRQENAPRRPGFACPQCHAAPPLGEFWLCHKCRKPFDIFGTQAQCLHCHAQYAVVACPSCGSLRPVNEWQNSPPPAP